jgi:hypothetical protein
MASWSFGGVLTLIYFRNKRPGCLGTGKSEGRAWGVSALR